MEYTMTPDEIYERLGLIEPIVHRVAAKHRVRQLQGAGELPDYSTGRRSGKTTETIIRALAALSETDKVVMIVDSLQHKQSLRQAQRWASELGLDASRLRVSNGRNYGFHRGWDRDRIFVDPDAWQDMDLHDRAYLNTVDPR